MKSFSRWLDEARECLARDERQRRYEARQRGERPGAEALSIDWDQWRRDNPDTDSEDA